MTPEHLHTALNHIPIIGIAIALLPILGGFFFKNKGLLITGLIIATACGWVTPIVMETGEEAYERYEEGPIRPFLDANVKTYLEIHEERAEAWSKAIYAATILATLCLAWSLFQWKYARWFSLVVALACIVAVGAGIWIAESGGKIRRVDFRDTSNQKNFRQDLQDLQDHGG